MSDRFDVCADYRGPGPVERLGVPENPVSSLRLRSGVTRPEKVDERFRRHVANVVVEVVVDESRTKLGELSGYRFCVPSDVISGTNSTQGN